MSKKTKAAEKEIEEIMTGDFKVTGDGKKLVEQMQAQLSAAGIESLVGIIAHVGTCKDGTFQVQFNADGHGYSSRWPEWAYVSAKEALAHGKKIWVIYDGSGPFGRNLLQTLVLNWVA